MKFVHEAPSIPSASVKHSPKCRLAHAASSIILKASSHKRGGITLAEPFQTSKFQDFYLPVSSPESHYDFSGVPLT